MSAPRRVRLVGPQALPALRPIDAVTAAGMYPSSTDLAGKWLAAIGWLRRDPARSKWLLDHQTERKA